MRKQRRQGFTLPELLIYALLTSLVLAGVYAAFTLSYRYYAAGESSVAAQQEALKAAAGIDQALRGAAAGTLTVQADPAALRFLSADRGGEVLFDHNGDAELMWNRWVCLYFDPSAGSVVLKEQPLPTPSADVPTSVPAISDIIADGALQSRILARDVAGLSFGTTAAENGTDALVTYRITARTDSPRFGNNEITLTSRSLVKNQD